MKKDYNHVTAMETIMVHQEKLVKKSEEFLKEVEDGEKDYITLMNYYYSEQRMRDLEDEEHHLIPEEIHRGVLSEDELYNLFADTRSMAIHMMETALAILKMNE